MAKAKLVHDVKKFKVGDVVRISRDMSYWGLPYEVEYGKIPGYKNSVVKEMNKFIGEIHTVSEVEDGGCYLRNTRYSFPSCMLTKVGKK